MKLTVEYRRLDAIERWPGNPKDHDLGGIIASIKTHGYVPPGMIDENTGWLVAGNGRHEALESMMRAGEKLPRRVRVDPADGMWLMPVYRGARFPDRDTAYAFVVADNQASIRGGWNKQGLLDALLSIVEFDGLLEATGYTDEDMEALHKTVYSAVLLPPPSVPEKPDSDKAMIFIRMTKPDAADDMRAAIATLMNGNPQWLAQLKG